VPLIVYEYVYSPKQAAELYNDESHVRLKLFDQQSADPLFIHRVNFLSLPRSIKIKWFVGGDDLIAA